MASILPALQNGAQKILTGLGWLAGTNAAVTVLDRNDQRTHGMEQTVEKLRVYESGAMLTSIGGSVASGIVKRLGFGLGAAALAGGASLAAAGALALAVATDVVEIGRGVGGLAKEGWKALNGQTVDWQHIKESSKALGRGALGLAFIAGGVVLAGAAPLTLLGLVGAGMVAGNAWEYAVDKMVGDVPPPQQERPKPSEPGSIVSKTPGKQAALQPGPRYAALQSLSETPALKGTPELVKTDKPRLQVKEPHISATMDRGDQMKLTASAPTLTG